MKNKLLSPLLVLVLWSILLRIVVYLLLPPAKELSTFNVGNLLFFSALTEHFEEFIRFTTQIPPATFFINATVLFLFGIKTVIHIRAFLLLVFLMDVVAIILLFKASKKMESNKSLSFIILLLFSTALVPFELWREGMHYDHHTIFFTSLFAWSVVLMIKGKFPVLNSLLVSITGGLLISQSAANAAIVPVSILVILMLMYIPKKEYRKLLLSTCITLSLPIILLLIISKKNHLAGGESLTSNKGGPAMMMVVQKANNYNVSKVRSVIQKAGAPNWYLWTYDHATVPTDPTTGKYYDGWINLSQAFGICFFDKPSPENAPWSFNFTPLLTYLRQNKLTALVNSVESDSSIAISKPYLFAGYSPELAPGWIGIYGDFSKKIYFYSLLENPGGMIKAFIEQQAVFAIYGPFFPYNTTQRKRNMFAHAGLRTFQNKLPFQLLFVLTTLLFALLLFGIYLLMLFNLPFFIWQSIKAAKTQLGNKSISVFTMVSIPALLIAIVFSCLVGGENDRYFMQATPYLVLLMTCYKLPIKGEPLLK